MLTNAATTAKRVRRIRGDDNPQASTAGGKLLDTNPLAEWQKK